MSAGKGSLFTPSNVANLIMQNSDVVILATGMLLCILTGGNIDLSVGSIVALTLLGRGIPVSCEVDIYGALSEYIGICVSGAPVTLLDINNSVPASIYDESIAGKTGYHHKETFMGFHCGNTCPSLLRNPHMGYQLIMKRDREPDLAEPDITRGTMAGDITFYRLQSTASTPLRAYVAQGEVLDVPTQSFGSIGIFAISEMDRFYRHVLIEKQYPHHGAVAFGHYGKALFEVFKYLGVADIAYNQPKTLPYPTENPFA